MSSWSLTGFGMQDGSGILIHHGKPIPSHRGKKTLSIAEMTGAPALSASHNDFASHPRRF
jgi:hypothetical protein